VNRIKQAFSRKLGPLPAWAWLGIAVGGVLAYRYYQARKQGSLVATGPFTPGTPADPTPPADVVPLDPGQGAYDPNTGHLVTNPDTSQPADAAGELVPPDAAMPPDNAPAVATGPAKKARKPKPKGKGKRTRGRVAPRKGHAQKGGHVPRKPVRHAAAAKSRGNRAGAHTGGSGARRAGAQTRAPIPTGARVAANRAAISHLVRGAQAASHDSGAGTVRVNAPVAAIARTRAAAVPVVAVRARPAPKTAPKKKK
jgi:hypothetical protein